MTPSGAPRTTGLVIDSRDRDLYGRRIYKREASPILRIDEMATSNTPTRCAVQVIVRRIRTLRSQDGCGAAAAPSCKISETGL